MSKIDLSEQLDVLRCELDVRPAGAPTVDEIAPALRSVERTSDALALSFAPSARDLVEQFVDAEQRCCSTLSWSVDAEPSVTKLLIVAAPAQLDVLEQLFSRSS